MRREVIPRRQRFHEHTARGRAIERADSNVDPVAPGGLPEEARAAFLAEPAASVPIALRAVQPAQRALVDESQMIDLRGGECPEISAPASALLAVAQEDVAQRAAHLVGDGPAQTVSCRAGLRHRVGFRVTRRATPPRRR